MNDKIIIPTFNVAYVSLTLITLYLLHVNYLKERMLDNSSGIRIKKTTLICLLLCYIF